MEITVNGKLVTVERLTPAQSQQHVNAMRDLLMIDVKRQMIGLPEEICRNCWDSGRAQAERLEFFPRRTAEYITAATSFPGLAHGLYIALGGSVENLTIDVVMNLLGDAEHGFEAFKAAMLALNLEIVTQPVDEQQQEQAA